MADPRLRQSGVYAIRNLVSGGIYVGSGQTIGNRWAAHRSYLVRGKHHSPTLQRSWDTHGAEAFSFEILEMVPSLDDLLAREQYWIDTLQAACPEKGFNRTPIAHKTRRRPPMEIPPAGGIYVIRNNLDDRVYVGSTINFKRRWKTHRAFLNTGRGSYALQTFWDNNTDRVNLTFEILERIEDRSQIAAREQYWIGALNAADPAKGFNAHPNSYGATGVKRRPESVAKLTAALTGRKRSPEFCELMRQMNLGRKHSEQSKELRRLRRLGPSKFDQRDMTYEDAIEIRSRYAAGGITQKELADHVGTSLGYLRDILYERVFKAP